MMGGRVFAAPRKSGGTALRKRTALAYGLLAVGWSKLERKGAAELDRAQVETAARATGIDPDDIHAALRELVEHDTRITDGGISLRMHGPKGDGTMHVRRVDD
jgi:hypothetical protein